MNEERMLSTYSAARYIAEIEALLGNGVQQVTLKRKQLENLLKIVKKASRKKTDSTTGRLRRALYRAEMSARRIANVAERERTK